MIQILLTFVSKLTVAIYQECLVLFSIKQNYYYLTSTFQESKTLHLPFWVASHLNFRQFYPIGRWSLNKQLGTIIKNNSTYHVLGFPDGSVVKNLPAMRNTWFWFLGLVPGRSPVEWDDYACSIFAWSLLGLQRVEQDWVTNTCTPCFRLYTWFPMQTHIHITTLTN